MIEGKERWGNTEYVHQGAASLLPSPESRRLLPAGSSALSCALAPGPRESCAAGHDAICGNNVHTTSGPWLERGRGIESNVQGRSGAESRKTSQPGRSPLTGTLVVRRLGQGCSSGAQPLANLAGPPGCGPIRTAGGVRDGALSALSDGRTVFARRRCSSLHRAKCMRNNWIFAPGCIWLWAGRGRKRGTVWTPPCPPS